MQVIALRQELEEGGRVGSATPAAGGGPDDEHGANGGSHPLPAVVSTPHRPPAPLQRGGSFTSPRGTHIASPSHARGGATQPPAAAGSDAAADLERQVAELTEALKAEQLRFDRTRAAMEDDRGRWQVRPAASPGCPSQEPRDLSSLPARRPTWTAPSTRARRLSSVLPPPRLR